MEHAFHFAQSFTVEIVAVFTGGAVHHMVVKLREFHKKRCLLCRRPHATKTHPKTGEHHEQA